MKKSGDEMLKEINRMAFFYRSFQNFQMATTAMVVLKSCSHMLRGHMRKSLKNTTYA